MVDCGRRRLIVATAAVGGVAGAAAACLLRDRLVVTAGLRYEETKDDGLGGLIDPSRIYQRDSASANGWLWLRR